MAQSVRILLWLFLAAAPACPGLASPVKSFEFQTPRPYGYVIGDEIAHRVVIEVEKPYRLVGETLPAPGRLNRWLELSALEMSREEAGGMARYRLDLNYQTFYAPLTVTTLAIPGFSLSFEKDGERVEQAVKPWYFTLSPIRDLAVAAETGGEYLRPDAPAALLEGSGHRLRLVLYSVAAVFTLSAFLYFFGLLPFLSRGQVFNRACRTLAALAGAPSDPEAYRSAMTAVHRAFNTLHGEPLFGNGLDAFFRRHPQFLPARAEIEAFFDASHAVFFSASAESRRFPLSRLKAFCRLLRAIERGMG